MNRFMIWFLLVIKYNMYVTLQQFRKPQKQCKNNVCVWLTSSNQLLPVAPKTKNQRRPMLCGGFLSSLSIYLAKIKVT